MSTLINTFLRTGREILALEKELRGMPSTDPRRRPLGEEHTRLMRRQQEEILAAHRAGATWETIEFALIMHGQSAERETGSTDPTPAEHLLALMRRYGAEAVMRALDEAKRQPQTLAEAGQ